MRRYLLKRLLISLPTLLGICIVTFCIMRLSPGGPSRKGPMETDAFDRDAAADSIERTRKLFGLDQPMLLNLDVQDRRRTVLSAWENLVEESAPAGETEGHAEAGENRSADRQKALRALEGLGKRLIPYLVPEALAAGEDSGRFARIAAVLERGAGLDCAKDPKALARWWAEQKPLLEPAAIRADLLALDACPSEEAEARAAAIRADLGELAAPVLMELLAAESDPSSKPRWLALVAPFAGVPLAAGFEGDPRRRRDAWRRIQRWWDREGLAFREITTGERLLRTFTETQFGAWMSRIARFDFGESFIDFQPVAGKVWRAFKVTFSFQVLAIFLIYLIAVPLGVLAAVRQNRFSDRLITIGLFALYSLPNFWAAYLLIYLVGGGEGILGNWFPVQGLHSQGAEALAWLPRLWDRLYHMVLPLTCMTYAGLAVIARFTRAGMLEVIRQDYIRTARAKGLSERTVILKHALRNGIIPIVTLLGGLLPALISGSVIVEYIFGIQGMGWLGYNAVLQRDYPVVMAIAFLSAVLVLLGTLLSDVLYALVDPRIAFEGEEA